MEQEILFIMQYGICDCVYYLVWNKRFCLLPSMEQEICLLPSMEQEILFIT